MKRETRTTMSTAVEDTLHQKRKTSSIEKLHYHITHQQNASSLRLNRIRSRQKSSAPQPPAVEMRDSRSILHVAFVDVDLDGPIAKLPVDRPCSPIRSRSAAHGQSL